MLINRNDVVTLIDQGREAMVAGDKSQAMLSYYQASKLLFVMAKHKRGVQRRMYDHQAKRLQDVAQRLEHEMALTTLSEDRQQDIKTTTPPKATKPSTTEITPITPPTTRFDDVIGLDEVIEQIRAQTILAWNNPELARIYKQDSAQNLLFYGPPGTGKTLLVRALAGELDVPLYTMKVSDILSKWIGESESNVAALFEEARKQPRAIVFVDEFDDLAGKRDGNAHEASKRLVSQFLTELEGLSEDANQSLLFIGACNHPWAMDAAILRRLTPMYIGLPDHAARKALFNWHLKDMPYQSDLDIAALADMTKHYSGSDISKLIEKAGSFSFREALRTDNINLINMDDFKQALKIVKRSVTDELLAEYDAYLAKLDGGN